MDINRQEAEDMLGSVDSADAPKTSLTNGEKSSMMTDDKKPSSVSVTSPIISVDDIVDDSNKEISPVNGESEPKDDQASTEMNGNSPPRVEVTPPRIQISPEARDQDRVETASWIGRPSSSSLSPSRIPSRKNSASIQTASGQSEAVNDDLKALESRLERFVTKSSEGSETSDNSDMSGEL